MEERADTTETKLPQKEGTFSIILGTVLVLVSLGLIAGLLVISLDIRFFDIFYLLGLILIFGLALIFIGYDERRGIE